MEIFKKSIFEVIKTFLFSIICSLIFTALIYRESALSDGFVCTFLNTAALLIFLFFQYFSWSRLYESSNDAFEYFIPAFASFGVYAITSAIFYALRASFYMLVFLPTRFLEPQLSIDTAFLSILITYALQVILIFITPILYLRRM